MLRRGQATREGLFVGFAADGVNRAEDRDDDLARGDGGLPPTEGLRWYLTDASRIIARPSGTEPKLKVYLEVIEPVSDDDLRGMGDNVSAIACAVGEQRQAAAELSRTTTEAAGAVSGVNEDVTAIGEATVATSTGAGEMTGASLELSRLSADLRTHVAAFLEQIR